MALDPSRLTPGVLDGAAENAFKYGACGALAIAMHQATGWPLVGVTDAHNVHGTRMGGGSALHWAVRRPDGKIVDVTGAHDPEDLIEEYRYKADDCEAAIGTATMADLEEWYVLNQGAPIPVKLAAAFVDAVIERASQPEDTPHPG